MVVQGDDADALAAAVQAGIVVAPSTRAGSGRVFTGTKARARGCISADNLNPQKARIPLALALTADPAAIEAMFEEY